MKYNGPQTLVCIRITWRAYEDRFLDLTLRVSDSVGLSWGLRNCISNKLPGDVVLLVHVPYFENH